MMASVPALAHLVPLSLHNPGILILGLAILLLGGTTIMSRQQQADSERQLRARRRAEVSFRRRLGTTLLVAVAVAAPDNPLQYIALGIVGCGGAAFVAHLLLIALRTSHPVRRYLTAAGSILVAAYFVGFALVPVGAQGRTMLASQITTGPSCQWGIPDGITVTSTEPFNNPNPADWTFSAHQTVPFNDGGNNVVRSTGTGNDYSAEFYRNAYTRTNGSGVQVRFKVDSQHTIAFFSLEANDAAGYLRFGIQQDMTGLVVQYIENNGSYYPTNILSTIQLNTWYVVQLAVDDVNGFVVRAYQESAPSVRGEYRRAMPAGRSWRFHHWIRRDHAYIDDYSEFNGSLIGPASVFSNATIVREEPFNSPSAADWTFSAHQTVPFNDGGNNVVRNTGTDNDYNAHFSRSSYTLTDGTGIQIRYKAETSNPIAFVSVEADDPTASHRFGLQHDMNGLRIQYIENGSVSYPTYILPTIQLNTWYVVRIAIDDVNGFVIQAYKESDPSVQGTYRRAMPTGKRWRFHDWMRRDRVYFDDYKELQLALCAPAPLPDGSYNVLHNAAPSTPWTMFAGLGTNVVFGNFVNQQTDLAIPGRGAALNLTRTYNSADPTDIGFGPGWSYTYGMSITPEAGGTLLVRHADGRRDRYTPSSGGNFTPPSGIYDKLTANPDGTYTLTTPDQFAHRFDTTGRLTSIADRNNNTTTLTWTTTGLYFGAGGVTITEPTDRKFILSYAAGGQHFARLEEQGALGRVVGYGYGAAGDLETVTDPRQNTITMTYEAHRLKSLTNQESEQEVDNSYDPTTGRVRQQRDAEGYLFTFEFIQGGRTTVDGPRTDVADVATYEHDSLLRVMRIMDPPGGTTEFTRDAQNNPTCVKDRFGGRTGRLFDERGNVTDFVDARYSNASCQGTIHTRITYTAFNDPESVTDPRAYDPSNIIPTAQLLTSFDYTPQGNLRVVHQPYGHTVTYTYDPSGNGDVRSATDDNGFVTSFSYDQWGYLSAVTEPVTEDTAGGSTTTTYEYDAGGRIRNVFDPLNHRTEYVYSPFTEPRLEVTEHLFPSVGMMLETQYHYDRVGQLVGITDANDNVTAYDYDNVGNLTEVVVAQNTQVQAITSYAYDGAGNRLRWTDADGRQTTYTYDPLDRLKTMTAPAPTPGASNLTTTYTYDDPQRQVRHLDPNRRVMITTYDPVGQVASISYPRVDYASGQFSAAFSIGYLYDPVGNRTRMTDQIGTTTYSYDGLNRLLSVTSPQTGWGPATVGYTYDQANSQLSGARTCTTLTYPQPPHDPRIRTAKSCADQAGRLRTVTDWHNRTTTYYYDAAGRLRDTVHPNLTSATFGYDDADRLTSVVNERLVDTLIAAPDDAPVNTPATPGTPWFSGTPPRPGPPTPTATPTPSFDPLATPGTSTGVPVAGDEPPKTALLAGPFTSHVYTLDGVGNRRFADELTATGDGNGQVEYRYDEQDRLREAHFPESTSCQQVFSYTAAGNHQQWNRACQSHTFGYDDAGRLKLARGATYTNDRNGNQTSKSTPENGGDQTWYYDGANRLDIAIGDEFSGDPQHYFRYDGDGLLVAERPWVGAWTTYLYDQTEANPAVLLSVTADGNDTVFSLYGHGLIARVVTGTNIDDSLKPESTLYYHYDGTGSVRAITTGRTFKPDGSQEGVNAHVVGAYDYHPYGELRRAEIETELGDNPILFAGEPFDKDTGQVYLRARRYDPATGRFTQPDPLGGARNNPFAYAANNPITFADHSGYADDRAQPVLPSARFAAQGGQVGGPPVEPGRARQLRLPTFEGRPASNVDTERVRALGNVGEQASGVVKNTERIPSATGKVPYRVPDGLDHRERVLREVKNVKELDYRSQLKDYVAYTQGEGYRFDLIVRQTTRISRNLQDLVDEGIIKLIFGLP